MVEIRRNARGVEDPRKTRYTSAFGCRCVSLESRIFALGSTPTMIEYDTDSGNMDLAFPDDRRRARMCPPKLSIFTWRTIRTAKRFEGEPGPFADPWMGETPTPCKQNVPRMDIEPQLCEEVRLLRIACTEPWVRTVET